MEGMEEREKGIRRKRDRKGSRSGSQREDDDNLREEGQRGGGDTGNQTQRGNIHPSFPSYCCYEVAFVYHRASADSPPALQIKLTASATGIHYRHQAGS